MLCWNLHLYFFKKLPFFLPLFSECLKNYFGILGRIFLKILRFISTKEKSTFRFS